MIIKVFMVCVPNRIGHFHIQPRSVKHGLNGSYNSLLSHHSDTHLPFTHHTESLFYTHITTHIQDLLAIVGQGLLSL